MFLIMFRKKNKNGNCQLFGKIIFFFFRRKIRIKNNKQSIIDLTQMPFVGPFVISLLVSSFWSSYAPFCYSIWHTFSSQQYDTVNIQWLLILKCFICCKCTNAQAVQVPNQPGSWGEWAVPERPRPCPREPTQHPRTSSSSWPWQEGWDCSADTAPAPIGGCSHLLPPWVILGVYLGTSQIFFSDPILQEFASFILKVISNLF